MAKAEVKKLIVLELSVTEAFATRVFLRDFLNEKTPREKCEPGSFGFDAWSVVSVLESLEEKENN